MQAINNVYKELKNMAIAAYPTDWDRATRRSPHQIIKDRDPMISAVILYLLTIY